MRRIWFAIVFLSLSVVLCITEQIYVQGAYKAICDYADSNDTKAIVEYWDRYNDVLYTFSDHKVLDNLCEAIAELEHAEDKEKALNKVRAITKNYYENERINISNIF